MSINGIRGVSAGEYIKTAGRRNLPAQPPGAEADFRTDSGSELITYQKTGLIKDKSAVAGLWKESERTYAGLRSLVEKMLLKQGHSIKTISAGDWENLTVDEETRLEAEAAVSSGGALSPEAVSDNIVAFAKAVSGGDSAKLETLKAAIGEGFRQAEKILGKLPGVCQNTYELVMQKLDDWAHSAAAAGAAKSTPAPGHPSLPPQSQRGILYTALLLLL